MKFNKSIPKDWWFIADNIAISYLFLTDEAVLGSQINTTTGERGEEEWKTPTKTRNAGKRKLSVEKETQEKKRSAKGSSPMMSEGRFDALQQAEYDEMKAYAALEREYYESELEDYEECPDRKDDGSEPSETSLGTATAAGVKDIARRLEFHDETKTKQRKEELQHTDEAVAAGVEPPGEN
jgi:hypothetical protein